MSGKATPTTWPHGDGEMAECIRVFDWAATPLGANDTWPQRLHTIIDFRDERAWRSGCCHEG